MVRYYIGCLVVYDFWGLEKKYVLVKLSSDSEVQVEFIYKKYFFPYEPSVQPPTLQEAILMIAKLVGFLGRKSDGQA
ncbi:hypothetical protein [Clostridium sp. BJN0013]|uniref:hypothetical protein n=1 Tax=Clostridium sp. BJN0013 TaxID=3236840 RepID=UPI0034C5FE2A